MVVTLSILVVTLLVTYYFLRVFLRHSKKVKLLAEKGIPAEAKIVEARSEGLQENSNSTWSDVALRFPTVTGKHQVVRHKKHLEAGEVIAVGALVELIYLEEDPTVYNVPSLGLYAKKNWLHLIVGILVLLIGVFAAYIAFINTDTLI